jgi:hypothetical protein
MDVPRRPVAARTSSALIVALAVAITAALVVLLTARSSGPNPSNGGAQAVEAIASAPAAPSSRPSATAVPRSAACAMTVPDPVLVPPRGYVQVPPAYDEAAWYGSGHLWAMLDRTGETWGPYPAGDGPFPQKTFWWSTDWVPKEEEEPAITVIGRRLDGAGSFRFGDPGTNATADFGTAMLVGVDVPSVGCWEITGHYRNASLSYVVLVTH